MKYYVYITADHNDADYVHTLAEIEEDIIPRFEKLANLLKTCKNTWDHNWPEYESEIDDDAIKKIYPDMLEEDYEFWREYIPYAEGGIHTINSIRILKIEDDRELMNGKS